LVDHPGSSHSSIQVALLGPPRHAPEFSAVRVATELLGGDSTGRLIRELVQQRSLASHASAQLLEAANGRIPILLSARTETSKTALATKALLEQIAAIGRDPPTPLEAKTASRQLSARIAARSEQVEGLVQLAAELGVSGLQLSHLGELGEQLQQLTPEAVRRGSAPYFLPSRTVVVVAGDAARVGYALSHFGRVQVRDRLQEYAISKRIGHNPGASLRIKPAAKKTKR
jgi:predicted Zn-dependent peptidase